MAKKNNNIKNDLLARWQKVMGTDMDATFDAIFATGADQAEIAIAAMESKLKKQSGGNGNNKVESLKNILGTKDATYVQAKSFIEGLYPEADDEQGLALATALYHAMDEWRRGVQYSSNLLKTAGSTDDTVETLYADGNLGFNENFLAGVRHLSAVVRRVDNYLESMGLTDNSNAGVFDPATIKPRGAKYTDRDAIFTALDGIADVAALFVEPVAEEAPEEATVEA